MGAAFLYALLRPARPAAARQLHRQLAGGAAARQAADLHRGVAGAAGGGLRAGAWQPQRSNRQSVSDGTVTSGTRWRPDIAVHAQYRGNSNNKSLSRGYGGQETENVALPSPAPLSGIHRRPVEPWLTGRFVFLHYLSKEFHHERINNDNYFARLSTINVSATSRRRGSFSYLTWPYAVAQLRQFDPHGHLGGEALRRPALPGHRSRRLRRGGGDGAGRHPEPDPSGAGQPEPADPGADQRSTSTRRSSAAWSRPSRCMGWACTSTPARTCRIVDGWRRMPAAENDARTRRPR